MKYLIALVLLSSCASLPMNDPMPGEAAKPVAAQATASKSVPKVPGFKDAWVMHSLKVFETEFPKLDKASKDMKRFCPRYESLTVDQRKIAWLHLFSGVLKRESGLGKDGYFKTTTSMVESNAALSQGLFQLTYGDRYCPKKKSEGDLNDPLINLTCGYKIAGHFAQLDGVVARGGFVKYGAEPPKGLARYWSVIRTPDKKSKHYLDEIIATTKQFKACQ